MTGDKAIRLTAVAAVVAVAGVAAYVSYWHAVEVVTANHDRGRDLAIRHEFVEHQSGPITFACCSSTGSANRTPGMRRSRIPNRGGGCGRLHNR